MKLVFRNSRGKEIEIANIDNEGQAHEEIYKFCAERNFIIHNIRTFQIEECIQYDVGSWSELFLLYINE